MNLLVVEDDNSIGRALQKGFGELAHKCTWLRDGGKGLNAAKTQKFDAIILDILLPGLGGLEVLKAIREAGIGTPVLLLTALGSVEERVAGLQAGADDYLVKPFAFAELLARVESILRRSQFRPSARLSANDLTLDLATRRVHSGERSIDLTPTEFSLLEILVRHAGVVVTRKMLCEHLWESDWEGTTNVIEVHINRLRNKLELGESTSAIQTVRGRGYVLLPTG